MQVCSAKYFCTFICSSVCESSSVLLLSAGLGKNLCSKLLGFSS